MSAGASPSSLTGQDLANLLSHAQAGEVNLTSFNQNKSALSSDQLNKIAEAKEKIDNLNIAVDGSTNALANGGLPQYKKFQEAISDNSKQLEFQKTLMQTGESFEQSGLEAADYVSRLHDLNKALDQQ